MENQIVGADGKGSFDFSAEGFDGFFQEYLVGAGKINQVVRVNNQRFQIVLRAQLKHLFAERLTEFVGRPLARTGGKNLQRVASNAVGAFGGIVDASGGRGVNADAPGCEAGRAFRSRAGKDVLFAGDGARHEESIRFADRS